ncbi:hypothetical protein FF1_013855 [Malus domestica]
MMPSVLLPLPPSSSLSLSPSLSRHLSQHQPPKGFYFLGFLGLSEFVQSFAISQICDLLAEYCSNASVEEARSGNGFYIYCSEKTFSMMWGSLVL